MTAPAATHPAPDEARLARACLDLTSLNAGDTADTTRALCARATAHEPWPAALCVWPQWVATARAALPAAVRIAAVANFPEGGTDADAAVRVAETIAAAGGQEVDLVLPWRALRDGDAGAARRVVAAVRRAVPGLTLKLIIESGELGGEALIADASRLGIGEGVDLLKTSTGKTPHGASPAAARTMLGCIAADRDAAGRVGFKASGGVRTVADAAAYAALVREILGPAALTPARFRLGASGLLDAIDAVLAPGGAGPTRPGDGY